MKKSICDEENSEVILNSSVYHGHRAFHCFHGNTWNTRFFLLSHSINGELYKTSFTLQIICLKEPKTMLLYKGFKNDTGSIWVSIQISFAMPFLIKELYGKKTKHLPFLSPSSVSSSFFYLQSCECMFILTAQLIRQINYTWLANFMLWDYACLVFKTKFNLLLLFFFKLWKS